MTAPARALKSGDWQGDSGHGQADVPRNDVVPLGPRAAKVGTEPYASKRRSYVR
jgi:hypothetical protein